MTQGTLQHVERMTKYSNLEIDQVMQLGVKCNGPLIALALANLELKLEQPVCGTKGHRKVH